MNKSKTLYFVLAILIGVFFLVYGGIDDSPGGQMIGLLTAIIGIVGIIASKKKTTKFKIRLPTEKKIERWIIEAGKSPVSMSAPMQRDQGDLTLRRRTQVRAEKLRKKRKKKRV